MSPASVVGGMVRDIPPEEEGADVDLAVEGDAIGFAYVLSHALGGRVTSSEFGTAIVSTPTASGSTSSRHGGVLRLA
jgi:tRNA nucleotidyltransferase/poly(A) polymerase